MIILIYKTANQITEFHTFDTYKLTIHINTFVSILIDFTQDFESEILLNFIIFSLEFITVDILMTSITKVK